MFHKLVIFRLKHDFEPLVFSATLDIDFSLFFFSFSTKFEQSRSELVIALDQSYWTNTPLIRLLPMKRTLKNSYVLFCFNVASKAIQIHVLFLRFFVLETNGRLPNKASAMATRHSDQSVKDSSS